MKRLVCLFLSCLLFCGCGLGQSSLAEGSQESAQTQSENENKEIAVLVAGEAFLLAPEKTEPAREVTMRDALPAFLADDLRVRISINEQEVFAGSSAQLDAFAPPKNGTYLYELTQDDKLVYHLEILVNFAPQVVWQEGPVPLGDLFLLQVRYAKDDQVRAESTLNADINFFLQDETWSALIPVHYGQQEGVYALTVQIGDTAYPMNVQVSDTEFEVQYLEISEEIYSNTAGSSDANAEWNRRIEPLKKVHEPEKYWSGAFIQPVQGRITTEFGMIRYTNGVYDSRHSGVDIAADLGTPVQAAGAGKVLFADFLQVSGNTVLIEHGMGLKSWYYHMDSLAVQQGEMVEQGQIIGAVGTTGFSTGPHLHFAMSVARVYINPWTMIEKEIIVQ